MKLTTSINALNLALAIFVSSVQASPVLDSLAINKEMTYTDGRYDFGALSIGKEGVALFWNAFVMRTSEVFVNNGIYYQTSKKSCLESESTFDVAADTMIEFYNRFMNNGVFVYDYSTAKLVPKFVALSGKIVNTGDMWFYVGALGGPPVPPSPRTADVSFLVDENFRNFGYIEVSGIGSHVATLEMRRLLSPHLHTNRPFVMNRGHILLKQAAWDLSTNIRGYGCISITDGAHLFLDDRIEYPKKQKINFDPVSGTATLNIDVHDGGKVFYQELFGFSQNCVIRFSEDMHRIKYRGSSLLLWRARQHRYYEFKIGPNYNFLSFVWSGNTVTYKEAAPKARPKKCEPRYCSNSMVPYLGSGAL